MGHSSKGMHPRFGAVGEHGSLAAVRARQIYASAALQILQPDESDETNAILLLEQYDVHRTSFTDCVSFAIMKRHRITEAFTFDHHFKVAGFFIKP